ncbi:hypothetical protein K1T71_004874 [Dendrolimus kikuchii]|uniref:Uncharacterized protein n=1 Tax=Dendrolimus kikuchii TaxID=765133 RepID=A0ACC1D5N8_9NEOP|nr:hypothetical protein K1T71_004874 [Dendrolimus kikuchii]
MRIVIVYEVISSHYPPSDRSIIDAVSGFINDVTLSSSSTVDPKDVIQWARFETADINEPTPEGDSENDISPLLLILGYGAGVQVWLIPPSGDAQEVLSWRQGTVRVLRILPTPQNGDCFASKRPLIALCDSASPGPAFCSLSFISIRGGEQVKIIKFKNPILDVLANKRSVVVSFSERFAVFDAGTLEDRMVVTTCYPCPCPLGGSFPINPLALGDRWLAYADKKLNQAKRSSGGCEAEGVTSYTATVLHAAKSLSKGLRGLGESVAHSLAGGRSTSQSPSPPNADIQQPGIVTILDIEGYDEDDVQDSSEEPSDPIVAHFVAHSEAIIALKFDASGMLLITADRRGHDFHVFRINPHPCGPSLASIHHLYILHRGDTTAKVQDIAISVDGRWAAVSTLRGTTHVFAVSPYGGACGVRTHTQPRVVNRLSRFHRSAGLPIHAHAAKRPSASPVGDGVGHGAWFPNPRLPPYPLPVTSSPLAQLRPTANLPTHTITRNSSGRQRLSSLSEDSNSVPLLARAQFGTAPYCGGVSHRPAPPVTALYLMAANGSLLHLVLHPKPLSSIPKEKICDESPIEVEVEGVAQWVLQRPAAASDLLAPLPPSNPLLHPPACRRCSEACMSEEERWLSQVEIVTHAGPHRRLWMGPQFVFKTYNCTGSSSSLSEAETVEVESGVGRGVARSNPVNMPGVRPIVPVLIDSGSASSLEHSPSDSCRRKSLLAESGRATSVCDVQLREDLAEAMKEDHGCVREESRSPAVCGSRGVERAVHPLGWVVRPRRAASPPAVDADAHTATNCDEALVCPQPEPRACDDPLPLTTAVVIPAALTAVPPWSHLDDSDDDCVLPSDDSVTVIEERPWRDACVSGSACAEQEWPAPPESLPNLPRLPADIQPVVRDRVKKPPTSASSDVVSEVSTKVKNETAKVKTVNELENVSVRRERKADETVVPPRGKIDIDVDYKEISVTKVKSQNDVSISNKKKKNDKVSVQETKIIKETDKDETTLVEKAEDPSVSEKVKLRKGIKITTITDKGDKKVENSSKKESTMFDVKETTHVFKEVKSLPSEENITLKEEKSKDTKVVKEVSPVPKDRKSRSMKLSREIDSSSTKIQQSETKTFDLKEDCSLANDLSLDLMTMKSPVCNNTFESVSESDYLTAKIKTEEQAWDMLLNEPDRPIFTLYQASVVSERTEESKPKYKKNRKLKKTQEEQQAKEDEDSFVEIHAIEEKQQPSSGDLVSISTPFEDIEPIASYSSKIKKSRIIKSFTQERKEESEPQGDIWSFDTKNTLVNTDVDQKKPEDNTCDIEILHENTQLNLEDLKKEKCSYDVFKEVQADVECIEKNIYLTPKETTKPKKSKSISPYPESRKSSDRYHEEVKDVYVIDSTKEEFPEIQITTKTSKMRKKSPLSTDKKNQEKEAIEEPIKSWSTIAATKSIKQSKEYEIKILETENSKETETLSISNKLVKDKESAPEISLQDKLVELCKRTDIMVAVCDTPSELNFVEEHHSLLQDFPPLDFGLDDFKLEVMRDSLLEVSETQITSPICNINIDNILSVMKGTENPVDQNLFNLIDVEKLSSKHEQGFSVVEGDEIETQEVKVDDERSEDKPEVMEKSSDDDIASPVLSADSDKEDKKSAGACNVTTPSSKQSSKSKKSRRKKK